MGLGGLIIKGAGGAVRVSIRSATRGAVKMGTRKAIKGALTPGGGGSVGGRGGAQGTQFGVRGAEDFATVSRRLKAAGGDLHKDVIKEIKGATKPLIEETRRTARSTLPQRGGLADRVARAPQRVSVRTGVRTAGVRVTVAGKKSGASGADKGTVRHPVYGRPNSWVSQSVPPGWFTKTMQREAPAVRKDVEKVVEDALDKIARKPL